MEESGKCALGWCFEVVIRKCSRGREYKDSLLKKKKKNKPNHPEKPQKQKPEDFLNLGLSNDVPKQSKMTEYYFFT